MSPIFQVIPKETKRGGKRAAQVIEPLQVIPEDAELIVKRSNTSRQQLLYKQLSNISEHPTSIDAYVQ